MTSLPNELANIIVSLIQDKKTLLNCSLVSRSFLSISRPAIFSQIHIFGHESTSSFLSLCDSPLCTIPLARTKFFQACEGCAEGFETSVLERLLTWVASDGSGKTLESILGAQLEELSIMWVRWKELNKTAERNLLVWFRNVITLDIGYVLFKSEKELSRLVDSFPKLQELNLFHVDIDSKDIDSDDEDTDTNNANNANDTNDTTDDVFVLYKRRPPKHLYKILFSDMDPRFLNELIRYGPTLRSFTCIFSLFDEDTSDASLPAIGEILRSAKALAQFTFRVQINNLHNWRDHFYFYLAPHIDFSSLRHLEIDIHEEALIIHFLEHISATPYLHHHPSEPPKPTLRTLRIPPLEYTLTQTDWSYLDALLQKPFFSSLRELSFCVIDRFTLEDYTGDVISGSSTMSASQVPELEDALIVPRKTFTTAKVPRQGTPAYAALTKRIGAIKERLPRCNERGLLRFKFIFSIE